MYMECSECLVELKKDDIVYKVENNNLCQKCFVEKIFDEQEYALNEDLRMFVLVHGFVFGV